MRDIVTFNNIYTQSLIHVGDMYWTQTTQVHKHIKHNTNKNKHQQMGS